MKTYVKYVYWVTREEEASLREQLEAIYRRVPRAKGVACAPLDEISKISSVAPEVWSQTCARQGSWYRASVRNGLYLIVSSFELPLLREKKAATITRSEFTPPRLAADGEKEEMVHDEGFLRRIPAEWKNISDLEKRIYLRWARRLGSTVEHYEFLYLTHTANHANFLNPRFSVRKKGLDTPYSIDRSAHLCSSCLELFQVLGDEHPLKLVAPCPGATIFARLKPDEYFLVEKP